MDPNWRMLKASLLEEVWVLTDMFSPLEVVKPVLTSELVLVFWGYFEVEDYQSKFVVAVLVMSRNLSVAEMCFFERCGKSD